MSPRENNMKKSIAFFLVVLFLCLPAGLVAAVEDEGKIDTKKFLEEKAKIIEPGVLPNSFWYWADIFSEEIRYLFVMGKESKGEYLIGLAEERLAEMRELSEAGITKYAEKLISKHEESIKKAEALFKEAQVKGWEKIQTEQTKLEKEIYYQETQLKKQAKQAPQQYEKSRDSVIAEVGAWLKTVISHLSWKRGQIREQESATFE